MGRNGRALREFDFLLHFQGEGLKAKLSRTLMLCYWFSWPKERLMRFIRDSCGVTHAAGSISLRNVARFNWYIARAIGNAVAGRGEFAMNLPSWYES